MVPYRHKQNTELILKIFVKMFKGQAEALEIHGAVIALYFEKPGHFPMVVKRKAQIQ